MTTFAMPTRACPQTQALPRKNSYSPLRLPLGLSSCDCRGDNDHDDVVDNDDGAESDGVVDSGDVFVNDDDDADVDLNIGLHHHLVRLENICRAERKDHHRARLGRSLQMMITVMMMMMMMMVVMTMIAMMMMMLYIYSLDRRDMMEDLRALAKHHFAWRLVAHSLQLLLTLDT